MGRMFRIISERGGVGTPDEPAAGPDAVPFIEVGGPEGVVSSFLPTAAARVAPPPAPAVEPEAEPELEAEPAVVPITAAGPTPAADVPARVLSVAFHRLPKNGLRLVPTGLAAELVTVHFPDHPVSHEYRAVSDEIARQYDGGPRVLGFTAALPESGSTTVLLNLAATLAGPDRAKVLVVDANFARPAVAARLGVHDGPGLAEVFAQSTPLAWAVQPTPVPGLHALTAGAAGADPALAADFPRLLTQLRGWFDWVLVDAGVWDDAARGAVATAADGVYLATRQTDLDRPEFTGLRAAVAAAGGVPRGYLTTRE